MECTLLIGRGQIRNLLKEDIWVYSSSGELVCLKGRTEDAEISAADVEYLIVDEKNCQNLGERRLIRPKCIGVGRDERAIYKLTLVGNREIQVQVVDDSAGIPGAIIIERGLRTPRRRTRFA